MAKLSRHLTAFTTLFGLFQFRVIPFSLQGVPATFQRLMEKVLQGLEDYAAAYIDDLVIHSATLGGTPDTDTDSTPMPTVSRTHGKAPEVPFGGMSRCVYLGYVVFSGLVQPERSKVQGVEVFPTPTT